MARVKYTGAVSDLSGSISGTTFQKNSSGSIARAKATQSFFSSQLQSASRNDFAKVSTYWSKLDLSVQQNWNAYAAAHPIYDRWGNVKSLNGFQYYMQSNINLLGLGLEIIPTPPVFSPQEIVPDYSIVAYSNSLHLDFYPAINYPNCDLVVYASAPTTSSSLLNRKNIWLIGSFASPNAGIFDIKSFYEQCFNITWSSFFNSAACNIVFQCILVNRVTGLASPFKGFILSLRNAPEPNWASLGTGFSSSIPSWGQSGFSAVYYYSSGIVLLGTVSNGKIIRSTNYGASFIDLGNFAGLTNIYQFLGLNNGVIISGGVPNCHFLRSTDYGLTWSDSGSLFGLRGPTAFCLAANNRILAAIADGSYIAESLDSGINWSLLGSISHAVSISCLIHLESGIILAGLSNSYGVLRSVDNGSTWASVVLPSVFVNVRGIVYCGNGIVCACTATPGFILRSVDFGLNWSQIGPFTSVTSIFAIIYVGNGVLFASCNGGSQLLKSVDFGNSWVSVGSISPYSTIWPLTFCYPKSLIVGCPGGGYLNIANY